MRSGTLVQSHESWFEKMTTTRLNPNHQITLPKSVREQMNLVAGDLLDAAVVDGQIILTPKHITSKTSRKSLPRDEQKILLRIQTKIEKIKTDILRSRGLTSKEADWAVKKGLVAKDQCYFWTEEWQKHERKAQRDIESGRLSPPAQTAAELRKQLDGLKRK